MFRVAGGGFDSGPYEVGYFVGVREHDEVGGVDLDGGYSGPLIAESFDVGVDGVVVDGD